MPDSTLKSSGTLTSWLQKGTWSIMDQGLFAGANFVVNVLLARWLDPGGYGAFTVAFALFLLLGSVHGGLLIEPMLVFGAGRFEGKLGKYLRVLLSGHALFALVSGIVLAALGCVFRLADQALLGSTLITLAWTQAAVLFLWMMRQACYVKFRPQWAAMAGGVYAFVLLGGVIYINTLGRLSVDSALVMMAVGSLAAGGWIAVRLKIPLRKTNEAAFSSDVRRVHWEYGKWASLTGGLHWFHGYLPLLILPIWAGLGESGALRALFNLIQPALHAFTALLFLLVPVFVRAAREGSLKVTFSKAMVWIGMLGVGYGLVIGLFGGPLMHALYDGKYDAYISAIWLAALLPPLVAVTNVVMALLRAIERPRDVFIARSGAAGVAATLGVALVGFFGFAGAILSDVFSSLTEGLLMLRSLRKKGMPSSTEISSVAPDLPSHIGDGASIGSEVTFEVPL